MEQENKKQKLPKIFIVLRILSLIMLIAGTVLIVLLMTVFKVGEASSMGVRFGGITLIIFSFVAAFMGFSTSIAKAQIKAQKYVVSQSKEDLKDVSEMHGDIMSPTSEKVARAVKKGLSEEVPSEEHKYCKECGKEIDKDAKFCEHCGHKQ